MVNIPRSIPGMSLKTHPWHFGAWAFSAVMFFATWRVNAGKKEAEF
jgi:hypothetical protein